MAREPHQKANYEYMEVERKIDDGQVELQRKIDDVQVEYVIFKPRAFNIVWGNDKRCWRMAAKPIGSSASRENKEEFAELLQVSWLEVTGVTPPLSFGSTYRITFRLSLEKGASGWTGSPVFLMAKVGKKGKYKWKKLEVDKLTRDPDDFPREADTLDVEIADGRDRRLYFGLYEVWSGKWKQGLKVYKATVKRIEK